MTDPGQTPATPAAPELQFDRLEPTSDATSGAAAPSVDGIVCASCGTVMLDEYHSIGGKPICASCRTSVEAMRATSRTPKAFGKAFIFGLGAALAGAAVYYAIFEMSGWQLSLVTIFIGWLIGRAIQKALPGGGSRRYQVLAAVLTYLAVGVAYLAIGIHGSQKDSASVLHGIGTLIGFAFSLPVRVVFGAGDIIAGLIIAIGMFQAWQMSGAPALKITGPFRVGGDAIAAGAS